MRNSDITGFKIYFTEICINVFCIACWFLPEYHWTPKCICTAKQRDTVKTPWQMLSLAWPPVASGTIWPFATQYTPPTMPSFTLLSQTELLQKYSLSWSFTVPYLFVHIHRFCTFIYFCGLQLPQICWNYLFRFKVTVPTPLLFYNWLSWWINIG